MNFVYLFLVSTAISLKTASSKSSAIMGAFEDCYETLIENGKIAIFSVEQKIGKVICDEGFKSTDGSNDVPCVGGKWKSDVACLRRSLKSDTSREKREVDESATTEVSVTGSSSNSINENDETSPPTTPTPAPTPPPTTAILPESSTTVTTKKTSTEKAKIPDDCPRECLQDRDKGNMIVILSLCLVGLMFLVIILVTWVVRERRRRTGEGVGRIHGVKKEAKKPEDVVLVDVAQVDGKQGNASQGADVKANDPLIKADGSSPKEVSELSDIGGNTAPAGDKQETLLQVAEANAKPTESFPGSKVANEVSANDNNSNKNEASASIVEPSLDKAAQDTRAELDKHAPPVSNDVEVPPAIKVKEDLKPNVQLQDMLKEAFGEGNNLIG